jgi:hypothetical protein
MMMMMRATRAIKFKVVTPDRRREMPERAKRICEIDF